LLKIKKNFRYISPICAEAPRRLIFTKFDTDVEAADGGVEICHFPLTTPVAVNTWLALYRAVNAQPTIALFDR